MPLIFLPPSKPRPKQLGAERQERLSTMTALGSGVSPQACRQVWIKRLSSRRHSRVQRANSVYSVPNGMSHSWPMLHAAKADTPDRHDRLAQGCSGQWRLRPAPCWLRARHGREFRHHRVDEGVDVTESIPRGRRSLGGSEGGAHRLRIRWLLRWPQTEPIALPRVSPHSPQSRIPESTGRHAPSANRLLATMVVVGENALLVSTIIYCGLRVLWIQ